MQDKFGIYCGNLKNVKGIKDLRLTWNYWTLTKK